MRLEPKPSFFAASCCNVEVVNGAAGFFRRSRRLTSVTGKTPSAPRVTTPFALREAIGGAGDFLDDSRRHLGVADLDLLGVDRVQLGVERLRALLELRGDRPVLLRAECADLALALDDHAERHGLHATGREPFLYRLPEQRRSLVSDESIEKTARLLGVDELLVDVSRAIDRGAHRVLGDLVEEDATDRRPALPADLFGDVPADRLAFAIRVGGDEDGGGFARRGLEVGERLFLSGDGDVLGFEALVDVDPELLLGEITDVPHGSPHAVTATEILADGLGLRGGLDDDQRGGTRLHVFLRLLRDRTAR